MKGPRLTIRRLMAIVAVVAVFVAVVAVFCWAVVAGEATVLLVLAFGCAWVGGELAVRVPPGVHADVSVALAVLPWMGLLAGLLSPFLLQSGPASAVETCGVILFLFAGLASFFAAPGFAFGTLGRNGWKLSGLHDAGLFGVIPVMMSWVVLVVLILACVVVSLGLR